MIIKKNILIVSHVFPPESGIGGRRWAKFAKYMVRLGYNVTVISADIANKSITSNWVNDVDNSIQVTRLARKYPGVLEKNNLTFTEKIKYKFWQFYLSIKYNGSIYDKTIAWQKQFLKTASNIITEKKIDTIIATGAPFSLLYYCALLKKEHTNIKLLCDVRDHWTWGSGYGYSKMSRSRKEFELQRQNYVFENTNFITVPIQSMFNYINENYKQNVINKTHLLPHAFDIDDFELIKKTILIKPFTKTIILGGSIFENLDNELKQVLNFFNSPVGQHYNINFYTPNSIYTDIIKKYKANNIKFFKPIAAPKFLAQVAQSNFYLVLNNKNSADILSTKFFEIMYLNIPIIFIGEKSSTSAFIVNNGFGYYLDKTLPIAEQLASILNLENKLQPNNTLLAKYNFITLTQQLASIIQ